MHITNAHLPFGGVGQSGIGSYHGLDGFKALSHYKGMIDKKLVRTLHKIFPTYP